jgi:hypothetical protein
VGLRLQYGASRPGISLGAPACFALALASTGALAGDAWLTLAPPGQGFSVDFPSEPTFRDVVEMQGEAIALFHDHRTIVDDGVFVIDVVRFTPAMRAERTDAELTDIAIRGAGAACEVGTPREIEITSGTAYEVTFLCPEELTMRARFLVEGEWLYQVGAAGRPGFVAGPDAGRFLDSFRLVPD